MIPELSDLYSQYVTYSLIGVNIVQVFIVMISDPTRNWQRHSPDPFSGNVGGYKVKPTRLYSCIVCDTDNNFFHGTPWLYHAAINRFCNGPMWNDLGQFTFNPHGKIFVQIRMDNGRK